MILFWLETASETWDRLVMPISQAFLFASYDYQGALEARTPSCGGARLRCASGG